MSQGAVWLLSDNLPLCQSAHMTVSQFANLPLCQSANLPLYQSVNLSVCQSGSSYNLRPRSLQMWRSPPSPVSSLSPPQLPDCPPTGPQQIHLQQGPSRSISNRAPADPSPTGPPADPSPTGPLLIHWTTMYQLDTFDY